MENASKAELWTKYEATSVADGLFQHEEESKISENRIGCFQR